MNDKNQTPGRAAAARAALAEEQAANHYITIVTPLRSIFGHRVVVLRYDPKTGKQLPGHRLLLRCSTQEEAFEAARDIIKGGG